MLEDTRMDPVYEKLFERTMMLFLGKDAYQIAGQVYNEKHRKEWYRKSLKKVIKRVQEIDTTTKHRESIAYFSERAIAALTERDFNETKLSLYLLCLVGSLLGFVATGTVPVYLGTFHTEAVSKDTDAIELMQDYNRNSVSVRKRLVNQLKEEGFNDFQIALVLNKSEYHVKKLIKEL
jgi:hypothetical protein